MRRKIYILLFFLFVYNFSFSQEEINEYLLASSKIHYKKYDDAEKILKNLISKNNRNAKQFMALGNLYFIEEKYEDAIKQYSVAMKNKNEFALYKIAECYSKLNDAAKTVEYLKLYLKTNNKLLQSEIKLNPNFSNIEETKEWINLWKKEYYNNYEKKLDEAKYLISKGDETNAFDVLDKLIVQSDRRHKAYEMRGDLLMQKGEYKNAAKSYEKASEIKNHNEIYKSKVAKAYFNDKNYKKSLKFCKSVISEDEDNINIVLLKAQNEFELKKYNKANTTIQKFLKYYPDNAEALNLYGKTFYYKKQYLKALEKYNVLLSDKTTDKQTLKAKYFENRADAYMAVSMYENVIKDLSMALDLNPNLPEVYYKRGIAKIRAKKTVEACYDFKFAYSKGYYKASDMLMKYCR